MGRFRLEPSSEEDVRWAAALGAKVYAGYDAIPEARMLAWYAANPDGFSIVKSDSGERVGNVDLLPLKPAALAGLLAGQLLECEITAGCLYTPSERACIQDVYLESVVARTERLQRVPGASAAIRANFAGLIGRVCDLLQVRGIYAIAASPSGARFLSRLGFVKAGEAADRRDGHDLYAYLR